MTQRAASRLDSTYPGELVKVVNGHNYPVDDISFLQSFEEYVYDPQMVDLSSHDDVTVRIKNEDNGTSAVERNEDGKAQEEQRAASRAAPEEEDSKPEARGPKKDDVIEQNEASGEDAKKTKTQRSRRRYRDHVGIVAVVERSRPRRHRLLHALPAAKGFLLLLRRVASSSSSSSSSIFLCLPAGVMMSHRCSRRRPG